MKKSSQTKQAHAAASRKRQSTKPTYENEPVARVAQGKSGSRVSTRRRIVWSCTVVLVLVLGITGSIVAVRMIRAAKVTSLCKQYQTIAASGHYTIENNNYAGQAECIRNTGGETDFTVSSSSADNPTDDAIGPSAYPEIFRGCHWGDCTADSGLSIQVSDLGNATSSWNTTDTAPGMWDVSYDIWYNKTRATTGQPNGAELMIWLNSQNQIPPPAGTTKVHIDGAEYYVTEQTRTDNGVSWPLILYKRITTTNAVSNLNLLGFTRDAVLRGYIHPSEYLISVEAGTEIWDGGVGLTTHSFSFTPVTGKPTGAVTAATASKCLTDWHGSTVNFNKVTASKCNSTASEKWTIENDGELKVKGKCLYENGDLADLYTCNGSSAEKWLLGVHNTLVNWVSGECLTDPGSNKANGTQLTISTCTSAKAEVWHIPS